MFTIAFVFVYKGRETPENNIEITIDTVLVRRDIEMEYLAGDKFIVEDGRSTTEYCTPINTNISSNEYIKYVYKISNTTNKVAYCGISLVDCVADNYLVGIEIQNTEETNFAEENVFEIPAGQTEQVIVYFRINDIQYDAFISGELALRVETV